MKVKEIYNSKLAKALDVGGITLFPFILYQGIPSDDIRFHESQHVLQIREWGFVSFYLEYFLEYIVGRVTGLSHTSAYLNISFEKEAYQMQKMFSKTLDQKERLYKRFREVGITPHSEAK